MSCSTNASRSAGDERLDHDQQRQTNGVARGSCLGAGGRLIASVSLSTIGSGRPSADGSPRCAPGVREGMSIQIRPTTVVQPTAEVRDGLRRSERLSRSTLPARLPRASATEPSNPVRHCLQYGRGGSRTALHSCRIGSRGGFRLGYDSGPAGSARLASSADRPVRLVISLTFSASGYVTVLACARVTHRRRRPSKG